MYEDWEGHGFNEPVLIDPLHGVIYQIDNMQKTGQRNPYRDSHKVSIFNGLPVSDYPLLIMERTEIMK